MKRDELIQGKYYVVKGLNIPGDFTIGQAEDDGMFFGDNYIHIEDLIEKGCEWVHIELERLF